MRPALLTSPKVNGIARFLESNREVSRVLSTGFSGEMNEIVTRNVMRYVTVTALLCVWGAANEHTSNGVFKNADLSDVDDMAGIPGFGAAMRSVGWLEFDESEQTVTLPNFNEYNTSGASRSTRAKSAAQRQKEYRERKKSQESDVTRDVTSDVTRDRREEKRREELKDISTADAVDTPPPTPPPKVDSEKFPMFSGWQPGDRFAEMCTLAGLRIEDAPQNRLLMVFGEFKSYWISEPYENTQAKWEHKLLQRLQAKHRTGELYETDQPNSARGTDSIDWNDTSWYTPELHAELREISEQRRRSG